MKGVNFPGRNRGWKKNRLIGEGYLVVQPDVIFAALYALVELFHVLSRLTGEKLVEVYVIPTDDDYLIAERLEQILDPLLGVVERRVEPDNSDQVYDEKQVLLNLGRRLAFVYIGRRVDQDSKEFDVRYRLVHERLDLVL